MNLKNLITTAFTLGILSIALIVIVTQPSLLSIFDLSSSRSANIGTTIAGITGPLLTLVTIYFLYQAFQKQSEGNDFQESKNDLDLIFLMIADLNNEYDKFQIVENQGSSRNVFNGHIAVMKCCRTLSKQPLQFFSEQMETDYLLYLIKTFTLIKKRVAFSKLDKSSVDLINEKLQLLFDLKFEVGYREITTSFILDEDKIAREFRDYYNQHTKTKITIESKDLVNILDDNYINP